ncbi:MAG: DeoD-type purine-nucleoside phosphorylase, partial [Paracoccaceae bacterium]
MTFHIGAKPGEIAETVLLPGDPYRARWAAETFLEGALLVNEVRGMLGFTGTWRGHRVTIHGSGMGMPSMAIYAHELMVDYGATTLIRIGSAGAMQPHIAIRDIVLAQGASTYGSPSASIFRGLNFAPVADFGLLSAAYAASKGMDVPVHVGGIYSSDTFYDERTDLGDQLQRHN